MIEKIRNNFASGVERLKWFSSLLSDRLKVEMAVIRLAGDLKEIEKKNDAAARGIGNRVFEVRGQEGADILSDQRVKDSLKEMETLLSEAEAIREKISEVGRAGTE